MREYVYLFKVGEEEYYVYSCSKAEATKQYLEEKALTELPKGCVITRSNI